MYDVMNNDTPDVAAKAIAEMPNRIIEAQSIDVDLVSGATYSSEGIVNAVVDALSN